METGNREWYESNFDDVSEIQSTGAWQSYPTADARHLYPIPSTVPK